MKKHGSSTVAALGLTVMLGLGTAIAQTGTDSQAGAAASAATGSNTAVSAQDKHFLTESSLGNNFEIKTAHLALEKASAQDVKDFAQKMITDHTKLTEAMTPITSEAGLTPPPPSEITKKDQVKYDKLQSMSGDQFDKAYIKAMVADHQKDLAAFKKEASKGSLPAEKQAAQQNTDLIKGHLMMAQQMATTHNVSTSGKGGGASNNSAS